MDQTGTWRLAPAYDLTFSSGPRGEHYLTVNGRGTDIRLEDVLAVAERQSINARTAATIVDEVRTAVSDFGSFAQRYDVPARSRNEIGAVVERHIAALAPIASGKGRATK
jgi:serine/threonine-protein kinase HipA